MTEEFRPPDDLLVPLLVAFDVELAAGRETPPAVPAALTERFAAASSVLRLLERAWPRRPAEDTTIDQAPVPARKKAAEDAPPSRLGKFHVLRELGRGGFGIVFLARDQELNRLVALKTPRWDRWLTTELRRRFLHEGRAAAALEHPNIVAVHEAGEDGPLCYIASAYCEGGSLAAWLRERKQRPVPCRQAVAMAADLAAGVRHAHGRGVLHRDLKPSNILLHGPKEGGAADDLTAYTPKICDFGLAKLVEAEGPDTPSGAVMGTPAYMAPEQAEGRSSAVGPPADVYGVGIVLYEVLAGRPPFVAATHAETLRQVCSTSAPPPRRFRKDVPRDLQTIVLACLEKDPARRYASAAALETDLRRWLDGKAPLKRPEPLVRRAGRALRRHKLLTAVALLTVLLGASGWAAAPYFKVDPDLNAKVATAALANHHAVTLIKNTGPPIWNRWATGGETAALETSPDGTFRVHTGGLTLLELLPDPGREAYRIHVQVRHENSDLSGEVGVYCGRRHFATPRGDIHSFLQMTYCDVLSPVDSMPPDLRKKVIIPLLDPVLLYPHFWSDPKYGAAWNLKASGRAQGLYRPAGYTNTVWRDLTVEVTANGIRGFWENTQAVGDLLTTDDLLRSTADCLSLAPNDPTNGFVTAGFDPHGGLGLYVENGTAAFRNFTVEPLD